MPDKYGPYAAVLNYPNKKDLEAGKTGSGIWIHGTGTNQLTPDTQSPSHINISEPTRQAENSDSVFCLKKKKTKR